MRRRQKMGAVPTLLIEPRATERFAANLDGSLRRRGATPTPVRVENLSLTGFSVPAASDVGLSELVQIDLPNLHSRAAKVIHAVNGRIGCEFLAPLTETELILAFEPPIASQSQTSSIGADDSVYPEPVVVPFPQWVRGTLAITLALASWGAVIGLIRLI